MSESGRHDAWQAGDAYDAYMGRWSRRIAPRFLDWFGAGDGLDWLDVGCGTGALSGAIVERCAPRRLLSIDPSAGFLATARARVADPRADFREGDAQALPAETGSRDAVVSGLVLNFVPDRNRALDEKARACRRGGTVGFYVWDYPGGGVEFMRAFWHAAVALDPAAAELTESQRFGFCTLEQLQPWASRAGLTSVSGRAIETPCRFADFDDYWRPFTRGAGPAPGYCASLAPDARERLRQRLHDTLPRQGDGAIALNLRAWAIKGVAH